MAHADTHPVTLFYLRAGEKASNGASAIVRRRVERVAGGRRGRRAVLRRVLRRRRLRRAGAIAGGAQGGGKHESVLGADPGKVTVLLAGLEREETEALLNVFANLRGVPREQILVLPGFGPKKK